jgi:uncharacterized membrane protein
MVDELVGSGLARELIVVIISALPIAELRGSLPVGIIVFDLPWYQAFYLAIIGNLLPIPILLLFFDSLVRLISRTNNGARLVNMIFNRTRRHRVIVEKHKNIGLILLVAIPLPGTGAWTGTITAFLLGLGWRRALILITIGVLISGTIVTILSLIGWVSAVITGLVIIGLAVLVWWKA